MADFLTRLAERTLNRVPVAQPVIDSIFAPGPTLPSFLPQAEAGDDVSRPAPIYQPPQEVTAMSSAMPGVEVQSPVNEFGEAPAPFTPKPSPTIAGQQEQVTATPIAVSHDKAVEPGRRSGHGGQSNIVEHDAGEQGDREDSLYIGESSTISSQPLIADQPPFVPRKLSLHTAPATTDPTMQGSEPGTAAKHQDTDPIQMITEHTEIAPPLANIAFPSEEQISLPPEKRSIITRRQDIAFSLENPGGEEHTGTLTRQSIPPGEESPGIWCMEEGVHHRAESPHAPIHFYDDWAGRHTPEQPLAAIRLANDATASEHTQLANLASASDSGETKGEESPLPGSSTPASTMTTRPSQDPPVTIVWAGKDVGRGSLWPPLESVGEVANAENGSLLLPLDQVERAENLLPITNVGKGTSSIMLRQDMSATEGNTVSMPIIPSSTGSEQPVRSANVPLPSKVEDHALGNVVASLADVMDGVGAQVTMSELLTERHLLVPYVQLQQEITSFQQTEPTPAERNKSGPALIRSQVGYPLEGERNDQLLDVVAPLAPARGGRREQVTLGEVEQHPSLPTVEATQGAPTIHVTIGRIDVRAISGPAPVPSSKPTKRGPALSLDDYLKKGKGGRQ